MSALNHTGPRRFPRPTSGRDFPETYYNDHHVVNEYPRTDPYAYPLGGPVSRLRSRTHADQDDFPLEQGGARRRIAVACARCRKRKIRCTGDSGDGQGCQNCKMAGVDAGQCLFHRVGSDQVEKVMDSFNMAQSLASLASGHNMMPLYSAGSDRPYFRSYQNQSYPQLEAKFGYSQLDSRASYGSDWTAAYGNDTSPVNDCSFPQSRSYFTTKAVPAGPNLCGPSCRCTTLGARPTQGTTSYYSDYGQAYVSNSLPYLQADIPPVAATEPMSPLNMSSLRLTLPESSRQRQIQPTEVPLRPRRRLPAPQPNQGHGRHHALDQQQDQRLRSSQAVGTPSLSNATPSYAHGGSFVKPLLAWETANENLVNAVNDAASVIMPPLATTSRASATVTGNSSDLYSSGTSVNSTSISTTTPLQELRFDTLPLLDPSMVMAPTPPAYSNFRESRDLSASAQLPRNDSSSSLYTFDGGSRRPSFLVDSPSNTLVSGRRYTPLSQPAVAFGVDKDSFGSQNIPLFQASVSDLSSTY